MLIYFDFFFGGGGGVVCVKRGGLKSILAYIFGTKSSKKIGFHKIPGRGSPFYETFSSNIFLIDRPYSTVCFWAGLYVVVSKEI